MGFDIKKVATNHGFDDAYLVDGLFVENAANFGLYDLRQLMPEAKSVLLLIYKHNPYKPFPKGVMSVHSHYPAYQKAYHLHLSLIQKLNAMEIKAKSANMLPLKSYAASAEMTMLKNSLMYHKDFGSYFVLQAIAVDVESDFQVEVEEDLCKSCTKCIEACPTGAIDFSGKLKRAKCIRDNVPVSEPIPESMRRAAKTGFIGCGICQAVCPLNGGIKAVSPEKELCEALKVSAILDLKNDNDLIKQLQTIIGKNEARPGRTIATTCMIAGNLKDKKYTPYLEKILTTYINPLARGYAAWALGETGSSQEVLEKALTEEHNIEVKSEIISALISK